MALSLALAGGDGFAEVAKRSDVPQKPFVATFPTDVDRARSFAIEFKPLDAALGRYAVGISYLLAEHHAVFVTPHLYYASLGTSDLFDGFGLEAGYRYFVRATGMEGPFFGGGAGYGQYRYRDYADTCDVASCPVVSDSRHSRFTAMAELGWQWLFGPFVLAAGFGAEYRSIDNDEHYPGSPPFEATDRTWLNFIFGSGLRPRVGSTLGVAF